ncbi:MAG: hypothetical protein R2867_15905 [Caldilineaceae bacterium]
MVWQGAARLVLHIEPMTQVTAALLRWSLAESVDDCNRLIALLGKSVVIA